MLGNSEFFIDCSYCSCSSSLTLPGVITAPHPETHTKAPGEVSLHFAPASVPSSGTRWALHKRFWVYCWTQVSELGADHTIKWRRAYSWLTSLTLWLGTWRWGNLTSSQRTGRWDSETLCFWQCTHCLSQQRDLPEFPSSLFAWVSSKQPRPESGVCFLPKRHIVSLCGLHLLASVLDSLQSPKYNPSCIPSRDFLGPCHGTWRLFLNYTFDHFLLCIAHEIPRGRT